jgi:hypothetical protein
MDCFGDGPILKHAHSTRHDNGIASEAELKALRHSIACGTPFSDTHWLTKTAALLAPEASLRPSGRPGHRAKQHVSACTSDTLVDSFFSAVARALRPIGEAHESTLQAR